MRLRIAKRRIPADYEGWHLTEVAKKAVYGKSAVYPFYPEYADQPYFEDLLLGAEIFEDKTARFYSSEDLVLLPPQFTPLRLQKAMELIREPIYADVETEAVLGGFKVRIPIVVAAMGSTSVASRRGITLSEGSARAGIIQVIGENVVTVHGYDRRLSDQPSFKERALAYLRNVIDDYGGLVIQQNVEDANFELWKKVYSDPDFDQYIQRGLVGFEIKAGQGAKPGLGGEIRVSRDVALKLLTKFYFPEDPESVVKESYERHSVPGTFTEEILAEQIRGMINEYRSQYRRVKIWVKTGPYRDLDRVIGVVDSSGADALTLDGKEGGSGMSPSVALRDLGYPTIVCLKRIHDSRQRGTKLQMILAGGLRDGSDLVKALCLGCDSIAMGRPFLIAAEGRFRANTNSVRQVDDPAQGIVNFVEAVRAEAQILASALGKYSLKDLGKEDVGALKREMAEMFSIEYVYKR